MAGGEEEFARNLAAPDAVEELGRRLQLKSILFGLGGKRFAFCGSAKKGRGIGEKSP